MVTNTVNRGNCAAALRERSNETWSGFAAPCGGHGLVAMDDCEECRRVSCERGEGNLSILTL